MNKTILIWSDIHNYKKSNMKSLWNLSLIDIKIIMIFIIIPNPIHNNNNNSVLNTIF